MPRSLKWSLFCMLLLPKFYMHFWFPTCVLHIPSISSSLI
jgi:hypothetical protein